MKNIFLISCTKTQAKRKTQAKNLYASPYFVKCLRYARQLKPDKIFALSSKHGLLNLEDEIEPYDEVLAKKPAAERRLWADKVLEQLKKECDIQNDHFILLAINKYLEYISARLPNKEIPLAGLIRGDKLHWLNEHISDE